MNTEPVQWITREMITRLAGPVSLFRSSLHDGAREWMAAVPVRHARPYRPMWRLGDWPSRYRVAAE